MKKVILNEGKIKLLKENLAGIMSNKLPTFMYKAVKIHNTSLGESPAFPPSDDYDFDYKLLKERYNQVINDMGEMGFDKNPENAENKLIKLVRKAVELEKPIRPQLEKVCSNAINEMFGVPTETILLECKLVDEVRPKNSLRILPEDSEEKTYSFNDVKEIEDFGLLIKKRRFINSLIQGYSLVASKYTEFYSDYFVSHGFDELLELYSEIDVLNQYLIFVKEEHIDKKKPRLDSYVAVHLGHGDKKTTINSQGLLFIFLLRETIRGFMELFSSHGLPSDNDKAQMIIKKADFTMAEPWDIRFGVVLWNKMFGENFESNLMPYFFSDFSSIESEEFFDLSKNLIAQTKTGENYIKDSIESIKNEIDYNDFLKNIDQKNVDTSLITDGYMSEDDLDNFTIEENVEDEINDKNHLSPLKHYLTMSNNEYRDSLILKNADSILGYIKHTSFNDELSDEDYKLVYAVDNEGADPKCLIPLLDKYGYKNHFLAYISNSYDTTRDAMTYTDHIDVNKQWLIHYTKDPGSIAMNGFTNGTTDFDRLAWTHGYNEEGYNFAFTTDKADNYFAKYYCGENCDNWGAVLFKANGVEAYHDGDNQDQIIFWGPSARDIVPLYYGDIDYNLDPDFESEYNDTRGSSFNSWFIIDDRTQKILYANEDIKKVVKWVEKNYYQYKNVLNVTTTANSDYIKNKYNRLKESIDEMEVYHGSENDFDKFDHRHHLSDGAGSQSFGYGSYFTNDIQVANGYVKNSPDGIRYRVNIPDDEGDNYFSWYDLNEGWDDRVFNVLNRLGADKMYDFAEALNNSVDDYEPDTLYNKSFDKFTGKEVYKALDRVYRGNTYQKYASQILSMAGYVGIKYPAGTRWNLPAGASKSAMNYVIFNSKDIEIVDKTKRFDTDLKTALEMAKNGDFTGFDEVESFDKNGIAIVGMMDKYNFITEKGDLISPDIWYDYVEPFHPTLNLALVKLKGKYNFISLKNKTLSDVWFNAASSFRDNYLAEVQMVKKGFGRVYNYLKPNGEIWSQMWFNYLGQFNRKGYALCETPDGEFNFVDENGQLKFEEDFEEATTFIGPEQTAKVYNEDLGFNLIDSSCNILSKTWFNKIERRVTTKNGNSVWFVFHNHKWSGLNALGQVIFDWVDDRQDVVNMIENSDI